MLKQSVNSSEDRLGRNAFRKLLLGRSLDEGKDRKKSRKKRKEKKRKEKKEGRKERKKERKFASKGIAVPLLISTETSAFEDREFCLFTRINLWTH